MATRRNLGILSAQALTLSSQEREVEALLAAAESLWGEAEWPRPVLWEPVRRGDEWRGGSSCSSAHINCERALFEREVRAQASSAAVEVVLSSEASAAPARVIQARQSA